ncbi:TetR/AcrR family transcriptional regulator [Romboutsia lituseburensis]|uniref:Regulatory protein, tetR family n=1 Tax=Romboutsia lituseburensis DSM 797 TaxID=1121325 RepID=A0A1G9J2Q3_9FIRM|nr:TetR/AcrR family transcriptional regulator [Romboutsia lituseburensis]CEH33654.1 TetR-transcriptional regulator [Romboutsia lituseburensis]SDL31777.1 regulatory protein, tetR family [Romboutsia lituseburensis DSM 797]
MKNKKENIIKIAQDCFNIHGIKNTSIDYIVKECKMSKSTFYKFFPTKEDLIWETIIYSSEKFATTAILLDADDTKTPHEALKEKIQLVLDYLKYNSSFDPNLLEIFSKTKGDNLIEVKNKIKSSILNSYKSSLVLIYGEEINVFIGDLIFIIDSLVHEFYLVMRMNKRHLSIEYIFEFIIRQIDININYLKTNKSIISESIFYTIDEIGENNYENVLKNTSIHVISSIKELISSNGENEKLYDAINKIEEEFNLGNYDSLIMDAMIAYLEKQLFLQKHTNKLSRLLSKLGDDIKGGQ